MHTPTRQRILTRGRSRFTPLVVLLSLGACTGGGDFTPTPAPTSGTVTIQTLGAAIYFDTALSQPAGQACASCHLPASGFADPDHSHPTSPGAVSGRFGSRNAPTASYAAFIPGFALVAGPNGASHYSGGQFWDGRANSLALQAQGPFLNQLEMNNPDKAAVVNKIRLASYADDFKVVFGANALDNTDTAYVQISQAIAAFERTATFAPFSSRFDAVQKGLAVFTVSEANGFALFNGKGQCAACHHTPSGSEVFSNFVFHNIGAPANPNNPFLYLDSSLNPDGTAFVDLGLGRRLNNTNENGKFRTPSLRNIALTAPYMHNGVFATLAEVINFYNRRDIDHIVPEVNQNVDNGGRLGNLGLTDSEIQDLIAFLETLTDGYMQ